MNNFANYYRQLVSSLREHAESGERDINVLVGRARRQLHTAANLPPEEEKAVIHAIRRDLAEFARHYFHQDEKAGDSVFLKVVSETLWKELADITDKCQFEWGELFHDLNHHGVYECGDVVGLGKLRCEKCHAVRAIYAPERLSCCSNCGHDNFQRQPFSP